MHCIAHHRDRLIAQARLGKHLTRPQPGPQRRHAGKARARLVSGGQQVIRYPRRRLKMRGAY
jgi:hypothetical protein